MLGLDPGIGTSAVRLWVAAGAAALFFAFAVLAALRSQSGMAANPALRAGLALVGVVFGAAMAWAVLDHAASVERSAERRAFAARAAELNASAMAPGSPLACLDAVAGESVEAACEQALFASPTSVASAASYVATRLDLLAGMTTYGREGGADMVPLLLPLRRSLEADRFGFLAHVLVVRDGCTVQDCKPLALLRDARQVRANLSADTFDHYVERYREAWAKQPEAKPADLAQPRPGAAAALNVAAPRKVNIDFPSAASIPPVSIMNAEPNGPVLPGVAAAAAANPNPKPSIVQRSRHPRKPTTNTAAQSPAQPATAVEPIWPEPLPPSPGPAAGAPVPLNPPAPGAGATARAQ